MNDLCLDQLCKTYGAVRAVDQVSLTVTAGKRLAIVGPSGSGKTSLLRLIAGFEHPDHGSITLGEETLAYHQRAVPAYLRRIGYVAQDGALFPHLTVAENIGFGLQEKGRDKQQRVARLLDMVSLDTPLLTRWPHQLSGGQQQRVALARALAQQPRLMLLDEPFSALDTALRASMRKMVATLLQDAGITAILVTHDQAEALSFADELAVMRRGRLVQAGSPQQLYQQPCDEETALFLGDAIILPARILAGQAHCRLGQIPLRDGQYDGEGRIMLRPEQLSLRPASRAAEGLMAKVIDCDFGGRNSLLELELCGTAARLQMPYSGWPLPAPGSRVQLEVQGSAHLLPD